ncbi:hypothetical protein B566_EDAN019555 [Ephemera danica]|nr:hypothetical protein B566_EDAN019555 [Ephemera danica]
MIRPSSRWIHMLSSSKRIALAEVVMPCPFDQFPVGLGRLYQLAQGSGVKAVAGSDANLRVKPQLGFIATRSNMHVHGLARISLVGTPPAVPPAAWRALSAAALPTQASSRGFAPQRLRHPCPGCRTPRSAAPGRCIHDPTTPDRQGNDRGPSYRSGIYFTSEAQRAMALQTIADVQASGLWPGRVVTEVKAAGPFWQAEPEHQDYLVHNPGGYTCHFVRPGWKLPARSKAGA